MIKIMVTDRYFFLSLSTQTNTTRQPQNTQSFPWSQRIIVTTTSCCAELTVSLRGTTLSEPSSQISVLYTSCIHRIVSLQLAEFQSLLLTFRNNGWYHNVTSGSVSTVIVPELSITSHGHYQKQQWLTGYRSTFCSSL